MNERLLRRVLQFSLARPRVVLLGWALLMLAATPFVLLVEVSTSTDSVLDRNGPEWAFYQSSIARFGGDEVLVVALHSDRAFDRTLLAELEPLSRRIEAVPGVRRVDSLATVPLIRVGPDGTLDLSAALGDGAPTSDREWRSLREQIGSDRVARRALLSADERVVAINVQLESDPQTGFDEVVSAVRSIVEAKGAWVSGVPVFRAEINRAAGIEIAKFVLVTVVLVSIVFFSITRSLQAVAIALSVGGVGTWCTLAALGATGTPITLITVILPSLMLALGVAYSMHLISAARGAGDDLESALARVMEPTALSGLTTVIGFLAVAAVRIDAIQQVGAFGALGVFAVTMVVLSGVPAALSFRGLDATAPRLEAWFGRDLGAACLRFALQHATPTLLVWLVLGVAGGVGLARVAVETDVTRWFPPGSDVRDSYEEIRSHLSGISPMNVVLESERSLTEPATLSAIDGLATYLDSLPEVGKALSVADPLRQLHAGFTDASDDPLPASKALVEQYLLLLDSVDYLSDVISADRTHANVLLRVDHNGSDHLLELASRAETWWDQHGVPDVEARATGIMFEFARAQDEIASGQIRGLALAVAAILLLMLAIFRSPRVASLAMLPNVLPLVLVFGFLGLAGIPMDAGIVVSGCLILGIAVDDTLHLVSAYDRRRREGKENRVALAEALPEVLSPVVLTTIVIGIGFSALCLAEFVFVRNLGILVVAVMMVCFLADIVLLPALIVRFGRRA